MAAGVTIYVWTVNNTIIAGPGIPQETTLAFQRGVKTPVRIQFLEGENAETPVRHATGTEVGFGIKTDGKFEAGFLAVLAVVDVTEPEVDDEDPFYTGTLNLNTSELNTALLTPNANLNDDVASLDAMSALWWQLPTEDTPNQARAVEVTVYNSSYIGTEATATEASLGFGPRITALESAAETFLPAVTAYTGGGSTKLDGVTTATLTVPRLFSFVHASDGWQLYILKAGTTAESSPTVIRPDDYATTTNEKIFQRVNLYTLLGTALNVLAQNLFTTADFGHVDAIFGKVFITSGGPSIRTGGGSPESAVTAPVGSLFLRNDGGAGTTLYVKESGSGTTGWVGK